MTTPIPVAEIIGERRYGGRATVRVLCVACGRTHLHLAVDADIPVVGACGAVYTIGRRG